MAAPARAPSPQPDAPARQSSSPSMRRDDRRAPGGTPVIRLASTRAPSRTPERKILPVSDSPWLAAGPGQPVITLAGPGAPLAPDVRRQLEAGFGADLGAVRVHQGESAAHLAFAHGARAFAYGHHVVLGQKASAGDVALLAHEVAHVLQQQGASVVQRCSSGNCTCGGNCGGGAASEDEAARASQTVSAGGSFSVTGQASTTAQYADEEEGWFESTVWGLLESFAPNLVPIIRKGPAGVLDWVKDKVSNAVQGFFDTMMAPVRAIAGTGAWLHAQFAPLLAWMQEAAAQIAQNNCKPITDAIKKIEDLAAKIITPVVEKLQVIAGKVGDFFKGLWDKFGAPAWEFIKKYAGQQWDQLQKLGEWIWDKTAPVRRLAARAWTWLKNKIGIGEGPEGQNGILQWIQGKATAAWDWVQAKLEPYKKTITKVATVVGGILIMISPAGPVILAGAAIYGVIQGIKWLRGVLAGGDGMVKARAYAQNVMIPQIMAAIGKMTAAVTKMAGSVSGKIGEFAAGLGQMVGSAAATALQFIVEAAQWLANKAVELATWATEKLNGLAKWIETGLGKLRTWLQPVLNFLIKVGNLLIDIYGLPILVAGELWNKIPSCIRDPFVDWIIPLILGQIDIFKELVKTPEAWQKTKTDVMRIIRLVFVTKDLKGAIKATFDLILRVFNVPVELLVKVIEKAQTAWDVVTKEPIKFLKNCVKTLGMAFHLYWDHLWDNLLYGIEGWLFGELADKGIQKPKSWTDPWDLFQFGLDVMGLSMNHIFELLEKSGKVSKETVGALRTAWGYISRAWDWIMEQRGKKPAEVTQSIIDGAKDFGKSILEGIVTWIVEQVTIELSEMAAAAAASAGLSEVLDAIRRIYRAIKTAVRWMRTILEMVNTGLDAVLNIAAGVLGPPAALIEGAMKKGTPAVIGFLGDQVGLGGIADEIKGLIDKLREKVDNAILAIINKLSALFELVAAGVKKLVGAVLNWWNKKVPFKTEEGKPHSIALEGKPPSIRIVVQSDRAYLEDLVARIPDAYSTVKKKAGTQRGKIEKLIRELDNLGARGKVDPKGNEKEIDAKSKELDDAMEEMGKLLASGHVLDVQEAEDLPRPTYSFSDDGGLATEATVEDLSANRPFGSPPRRAPQGWAYLQSANRVQGAPYFRQLHLINERLGGPGQPQNLAPGPQQWNSQMESTFESKIKDLVGDVPFQKGKNAVVKMGVKVSYNRSSSKLKAKDGTKSDVSMYPSSITGWFKYREGGTKKAYKDGPALKLKKFDDTELDPN